MVLIGVIVGYLLGIAPVIVLTILEIKSHKKEEKMSKENKTRQEQILDEYLNGRQESEQRTNTAVNQEDILKEYLTGIVSKVE